jgi:hypothetical protein
MDEASLSARDLRGVFSRAELRRQLAHIVRRAHREGIARLDTSRLAMRFPCRLRIALRSGGVVEVEGSESGASARPLDEQRAVIREKCAAVGVSADLVGDDGLGDQLAGGVGDLDVDEAEAPAALDDARAGAQVGAAGAPEEVDGEADGRPGSRH